MIRFNHLCVNYGDLTAVNDANFSIQKGEIFVIMGLSGCGKSSLLRTINGLAPASSGQVVLELPGLGLIDPNECSSEDLRILRTKHVSMVFQKFGLLPWLSARQNVEFGLQIRGASKAERALIACKYLEMVGLADWTEHRVQELSGGMQQRVGLARALACETDILLMDEPFSALDPIIRKEMQEELLVLQEQLHKTIVFVTHDLDEAVKIASRIAIMEKGRIVQVGTPEEILNNPATDYVRKFVTATDRFCTKCQSLLPHRSPETITEPHAHIQ